jgi:hypothetical protein
MNRLMTLVAQRYEVAQIISAAVTPKGQMMHFQIPVVPAHLASPAVPPQYASADFGIFRDSVWILYALTLH